MWKDRRGVAIDDFIQLVVVLVFFAGIVVFLVISSSVQKHEAASDVRFSRGQDAVHDAGIAYLAHEVSLPDGRKMAMAEFLQWVPVDSTSGRQEDARQKDHSVFLDYTIPFFKERFRKPAGWGQDEPWSVDVKYMSNTPLELRRTSTSYRAGTPGCGTNNALVRFTLPSEIHGTLFVDICVLNTYFAGGER